MIALTRTLAVLAILAALGLPHAIMPPRTAQADLCTTCLPPDRPEAVLLQASAAVGHAEGSSHHEQASAGA